VELRRRAEPTPDEVLPKKAEQAKADFEPKPGAGDFMTPLEKRRLTKPTR
jgi:hypothetical protein